MAGDGTYDPCPADEEGVLDIGHGVRIKFYSYKDTPKAGLIESHPRPDNGERCSGSVTFDLPSGLKEDGPRWTVVSLDPLHLEPSLLCRTCGHHGFIRNGRWVTA